MALNGQLADVTGPAMSKGRAITEILLQNGATVRFGLKSEELKGTCFLWSRGLILLSEISVSLNWTGNWDLFRIKNSDFLLLLQTPA